jgi:hypothetical protein
MAVRIPQCGRADLEPVHPARLRPVHELDPLGAQPLVRIVHIGDCDLDVGEAALHRRHVEDPAKHDPAAAVGEDGAARRAADQAEAECLAIEAQRSGQIGDDQHHPDPTGGEVGHPGDRLVAEAYRLGLIVVDLRALCGDGGGELRLGLDLWAAVRGRRGGGRSGR